MQLTLMHIIGDSMAKAALLAGQLPFAACGAMPAVHAAVPGGRQLLHAAAVPGGRQMLHAGGRLTCTWAPLIKLLFNPTQCSYGLSAAIVSTTA